MDEKALIRGYLNQDTLYFSERQEALLDIKSMNPFHAGNAAEKMLREANRWAQDSGTDPRRPILWMTSLPVFQALLTRAEDTF